MLRHAEVQLVVPPSIEVNHLSPSPLQPKSNVLIEVDASLVVRRSNHAYGMQAGVPKRPIKHPIDGLPAVSPVLVRPRERDPHVGGAVVRRPRREPPPSETHGADDPARLAFRGR